MTTIERNGMIFELTGTAITFGEGQGLAATYRTVTVAGTPSENRALIESTRYYLIELHAELDPTVSVYVDRYKIIGMEPSWTEVRENAGEPETAHQPRTDDEEASDGKA
jgi:hypothetical protein